MGQMCPQAHASEVMLHKKEWPSHSREAEVDICIGHQLHQGVWKPGSYQASEGCRAVRSASVVGRDGTACCHMPGQQMLQGIGCK